MKHVFEALEKTLEVELLFDLARYRTNMSVLMPYMKEARERGNQYNLGWYRGLWEARRMAVRKIIKDIRTVRRRGVYMGEHTK